MQPGDTLYWESGEETKAGVILQISECCRVNPNLLELQKEVGEVVVAHVLLLDGQEEYVLVPEYVSEVS